MYAAMKMHFPLGKIDSSNPVFGFGLDNFITSDKWIKKLVDLLFNFKTKTPLEIIDSANTVFGFGFNNFIKSDKLIENWLICF